MSNKEKPKGPFQSPYREAPSTELTTTSDAKIIDRLLEELTQINEHYFLTNLLDPEVEPIIKRIYANRDRERRSILAKPRTEEELTRDREDLEKMLHRAKLMHDFTAEGQQEMVNSLQKDVDAFMVKLETENKSQVELITQHIKELNAYKRAIEERLNRHDTTPQELYSEHELQQVSADLNKLLKYLIGSENAEPDLYESMDALHIFNIKYPIVKTAASLNQEINKLEEQDNEKSGQQKVLFLRQMVCICEMFGINSQRYEDKLEAATPETDTKDTHEPGYNSQEKEGDLEGYDTLDDLMSKIPRTQKKHIDSLIKIFKQNNRALKLEFNLRYSQRSEEPVNTYALNHYENDWDQRMVGHEINHVSEDICYTNLLTMVQKSHPGLEKMLIQRSRTSLMVAGLPISFFEPTDKDPASRSRGELYSISKYLPDVFPKEVHEYTKDVKKLLSTQNRIFLGHTLVEIYKKATERTPEKRKEICQSLIKLGELVSYTRQAPELNLFKYPSKKAPLMPNEKKIIDDIVNLIETNQLDKAEIWMERLEQGPMSEEQYEKFNHYLHLE